MDFGITAGDTDQTIYVRLRDSTTGLAKTGLVFNSAGAVASYTLPGAARAAITLATQTVTGAHSDGGFVEVDATNCKGLYRLDLPDAAIASGKYSIVSIEFDGIIEEAVIVPLTLRKADVRQWLGTAAATPTVAGVPEVDVVLHLGSAPNALQSGRYDSFVGAMGTDVFNAGAVAASAVAEWPTVAQIQSGLATQASVDVIDDLLDTEIAALTTELAKVPKSDGTATWNATALASIQSEGNDALVAFFTSSAALVDAIWDEALSGHTTADTAGSDLAAAKDNTDYPDGYVYYRTGGNAGTTFGVNGTIRNPSGSWSDAQTIANASALNAVRSVPGQSLTIGSGSISSMTIDLNGGILFLDNTVTVSSTDIFSSGARAQIYEDGLGTPITIGGSCSFKNVIIDGIVLTSDTTYFNSVGLYGDVTAPTGTRVVLMESVYNARDVGGGGPIDFDFTAGTAHFLLQDWWGDLSVSNMAAGSTLDCYGWGKLTIAASCTGGTIKHTSHVEIDDQASGAVTTELISEASSVSGFTTAAKAELQQEAADALNAYDGPTNAEMEARTLVAASYATAAALGVVDDLLDTEVAAIQTSLTNLFTTQLTESYRAAGVAPTMAQAQFELLAQLGDAAIVSTTKTIRNLAGTAAKTFTLDSSSAPTSITEST